MRYTEIINPKYLTLPSSFVVRHSSFVVRRSSSQETEKTHVLSFSRGTVQVVCLAWHPHRSLSLVMSFRDDGVLFRADG